MLTTSIVPSVSIILSRDARKFSYLLSFSLILKPEIIHVGFTRAGILAIIASSSLLIVSLRPIRKAAYELFFFAHFAMVLCVYFPLLWSLLLIEALLASSSSVVTSTPRRPGKSDVGRLLSSAHVHLQGRLLVRHLLSHLGS